MANGNVFMRLLIVKVLYMYMFEIWQIATKSNSRCHNLIYHTFYKVWF